MKIGSLVAKSTFVLAIMLQLSSCASTQKYEDPDLSIYDYEDEGVGCISLTRLDNIKVLGRNAIIFKMRGGKDFLNILPRRCSGLSSNSILKYESRNGQLCKSDSIALLSNSGPSGLYEQNRCGLGTFFSMIDPELGDISGDLEFE